QLDELVIELEQGDREAGHLEARDVRANEAATDPDALAAKDLRDAVEGAVELDERGPAHAVDEREHGVAASETQVGDDRRDEPFRHVVDRRELLASPARLTVDADPDFDLVIAEFERWRTRGRHDTARQGESHRPGRRIDAD